MFIIKNENKLVGRVLIMHSQEIKLLSAISAFCLMALVSLAVASFVYTNTQDHLLHQASINSSLSSNKFPMTPQQVASTQQLQDQLLATRSSMA
jgi:hypothetical protein